MNQTEKIYVAGHTGMVGSAVIRRLKTEGFSNIITIPHKELDLTNQENTSKFIKNCRPDYVIIAAAKVGGIQENRTYPADLLYSNIMINANIINAAHEIGVKKLMVLGSSCVYPREADQPMVEESFLDGKLEPTNQGYSIGKIAAIEMAKYYNLQYGDIFISCMPTNIYGENDDFNSMGSHVIPAMISKCYTAKVERKKSVIFWGTGSPLREFMYVDDLADAILFLMNNYKEAETINVGTGEEISIRHLSELISEVVGYQGDLIWDADKPDGCPRKLLDSSKIHNLGWHHSIGLREGIEKTYRRFVNNVVK